MLILKYLKVYHWPAIASGWLILTLIISYSVSVANGHVYYFFPYISDTGTIPPESCIFGQMMNIEALLLAVLLYIRYSQVEFALNSENIEFAKKWNKTALWSGAVVCIGTSMVGNFQEWSILSVHLVGAFMVFGNGTFFLILQTKISFALRPVYRKYPEYGVGTCILYFRLFLTCALPILLSVVGICSVISFVQYTGTNYIYWTEEDGGYQFRLGATFAELFLVIDFLLYLLSTLKELKAVEYREIGFKCKYDCLPTNANGIV